MHPSNETDPEVILEVIDIEQFAHSGHKPGRAHKYRIRIDDEYFLYPKPHITGREILGLVNKSPESHYVTMRVKGGHPPLREVGLDEVIDLTSHGIERFFVRDRHTQPG